MANYKPRVVVVGGGFGGMNAARELKHEELEVVLINKRNYHLFQPLLYQVATSGVSSDEIAYPLRAIFRNQENFTFWLAEVETVDFESQKVVTNRGAIDYDYLILAVGGETNFFGLESVARHGFSLKDLDEAVKIRNHILRMFELAEREKDPEMRAEFLTFAVAGGGPTGVECAGAISEFIRLVLVKDYMDLELGDVRVLLLEALDRLLGGFPESLQKAAVETLQRKHVEVRLGAMVEGYDGKRIDLKDGETIATRTLIWAAGVQAADLMGVLNLERRAQGRVLVAPTLQLPNHPNVYVIGDAAYLEDQDGKPLPMMAPVAIQQAKLAAHNILCQIEGEATEKFHYEDPGSLATIGRNAAVARIGSFRFSGFIAWVVWLAVHLFWLIGFRNRLVVLINWAWDYFFYDRTGRLITPNDTE